MGDNILLHEHVCLVTVWLSVCGFGVRHGISTGSREGLEDPRGKVPYAWVRSRLGSGYLDFLEHPPSEAPLLAFLGECDHAARVVAGRERPSGLF